MKGKRSRAKAQRQLTGYMVVTRNGAFFLRGCLTERDARVRWADRPLVKSVVVRYEPVERR